jgi:hypothetical protein
VLTLASSIAATFIAFATEGLMAHNTLFSLGMLRVAGWSHDVWSTNGMLFTEALTGAAALALFAVLARRVRGTERSLT